MVRLPAPPRRGHIYRPAVCEHLQDQEEGRVPDRPSETNPDIISEIASRKGDRIVVGFSMELDHLLEHARKKLAGKGMEFIVANDVIEPGAGFRGDTVNVIRILDRYGGV